MPLSGYFTFNAAGEENGVDDLDIVSQIYVSLGNNAEDMAQISFGNFLMTATTSDEFKKKLKNIPIDALTVYLKQGLPPLQVLINLYTTVRFRDIYETVVKKIIERRKENSKLDESFEMWYKMKSELTKSYKMEKTPDGAFITMVKGAGWLAFNEKRFKDYIRVIHELKFKYDEIVACDRRSFLSLVTMLSLYPCQALEHRILNDITYMNDNIEVVGAMQYVRVGSIVSTDNLYRTQIYDEEIAKVSINQADMTKYYMPLTMGKNFCLVDYTCPYLIKRIYLSSADNSDELIISKQKETRASVLLETALGTNKVATTVLDREKLAFEDAKIKIDRYDKCSVVVPISYLYEIWKLYNVVFIIQAPLPFTTAVIVHVDKSRKKNRLRQDVIMHYAYCLIHTLKLALDFYLFGKKTMRRLIRSKLTIEDDVDLKPLIDYWFDLTKIKLKGKIGTDYSKLLRTSKSLKKVDKYEKVSADIDRIFNNLGSDNRELFVRGKEVSMVNNVNKARMSIPDI